MGQLRSTGYRSALVTEYSDLGYFTVTEAAQITGVPRSTLDYWTRTELVTPSQRQARPRLFSFRDLRDIKVAVELRDQGVKTRDIRAALNYVRANSIANSLSFATFHFDIDAGLVVPFPEPTESGYDVVAPHKRGTRLLTVDPEEILSDLGLTSDASVLELRPHERIRINPEVRGGTPVIEGTRIPARLVFEMVEAGATTDEIREAYPSLTSRDIDAAVEWERAG